jgi:hypothetical protein
MNMTMNFGEVLTLLCHGMRLQREGWNGKNMYIALVVPVTGEAVTLPFIGFQPATGGLVPWVASHADMLSNDWKVYTNGNGS